jgi:hypothetical protein
MVLDFEIVDDDQIQHYSMWIDGEQVVTDEAVDSDHYRGWHYWNIPGSYQPNDTVTVRISARDYAGNTSDAQMTLTCLGGTVLDWGEDLTSDYQGEDLVLADAGNHYEYRVDLPLRPASLTLLKGVTLTSVDSGVVEIFADGKVEVACGARIDVSGEGYSPGTTYPGAELPISSSSGGSHLGEGGFTFGNPGETYGSVSRPREHGSGGLTRGVGGGVVRISTPELLLEGSILANGTYGYRYYSAGAGGSVWIDADSIGGDGSINARGASSHSSGGGGAIALECESIDPAIVDNLSASSGSLYEVGGAGTIYTFGPDATFGGLVVDNADNDGGWTVLPGLGGGDAIGGTGGTVLVTNLPEAIPPFFVGHWVEILEGDTSKGIWRVESVDDRTLTLEAGANVLVGDSWRGVYRFDNVTVRGSAKLYVPDVDDFAAVVVEPGSVLELRNQEAPYADLSKLAVVATADQFRVQGAAGSLVDPDGIASARVLNETSGQSSGVNIQNDGSFSTITFGSAGDAISLQLVDDHPRDPRNSLTDLGLLPGNAGPPAIDADLIQFVAKQN